jgi:hypothetical protein
MKNMTAEEPYKGCMWFRVPRVSSFPEAIGSVLKYRLFSKIIFW